MTEQFHFSQIDIKKLQHELDLLRKREIRTVVNMCAHLKERMAQISGEHCPAPLPQDAMVEAVLSAHQECPHTSEFLGRLKKWKDQMEAALPPYGDYVLVTAPEVKAVFMKGVRTSEGYQEYVEAVTGKKRLKKKFLSSLIHRLRRLPHLIEDDMLSFLKEKAKEEEQSLLLSDIREGIALLEEFEGLKGYLRDEEWDTLWYIAIAGKLDEQESFSDTQRMIIFDWIIANCTMEEIGLDNPLWEVMSFDAFQRDLERFLCQNENPQKLQSVAEELQTLLKKMENNCEDGREDDDWVVFSRIEDGYEEEGGEGDDWEGLPSIESEDDDF